MRTFLRAYSQAKNSALAERFQQILEEQISHLTGSIIDRDPTLKHIYDKYVEGEDQLEATRKEQSKLADDTFRKQYQKEFAYLESEKLLRSKSDKQLADTITNAPWTGTERPTATAARMLADSMPKAKPVGQKTIITPPVPMRDRIKSAKESSLDYKVTKTIPKQSKQDDNFRELYKERLMGPSMFVDAASPTATLGLIGSMADARINAAIDRKTGKFESADMDIVRGKPLDRERLANSANTNYFMNEILNKQDCLPPWIESQQGTQRDISTFKLDLLRKWTALIIAELSHNRLPSEVLQNLQDLMLALNETSLKSRFHRKHNAYITAKIDDLNQSIRSYNLQCPSSSLHKWKLVKSVEVQKLYDYVISNIDKLIQDWVEAQTNIRHIDPKIKESSDSFLGVFDSAKGSLSFGSGSNYTVIERPQEQLQFWKLVKLIFKP